MGGVAGSSLPGVLTVTDPLAEQMMYPTAQRLLAHADTVVRLPGASTGAHQDVEIACERGLPVWCRIEDIPGSQPPHEPGLVREGPA